MMKQLKLAMLATLTLLIVSSSANAQDETSPWAIGLGINAIDVIPSEEFGEAVKDYFGPSEWPQNTLPTISRVTVGRYIDKGISLELAGSLNRVEIVENDEDYASGELYWSVDVAGKYDLNNAFGDTKWFDPYVFLGAGYAHFSELYSDPGEVTLNAGWGFNAWINDYIGVNFNSAFKKELLDNVEDHYQHSLGLVFRFGGSDIDKDGVLDKNDACPEVPGLKEFDGCPDTDGDGIPDNKDACPKEKGTKAMNGCPDTDGDGVADAKDKCPKIAGPVENQGCPWGDKDNDGILDNVDKCPDVKGVASAEGCPPAAPKYIAPISAEAQAKLDEFARAIYFNSGKSTFKPGVSGKLDLIADIMKEYDKANFNIEGHTDSAGAASSNLRLSERRAKAVLDYLISHGISSSRLSSVGYGEDYPIADNSTRDGRAKNRRVEIKLRK